MCASTWRMIRFVLFMVIAVRKMLCPVPDAGASGIEVEAVGRWLQLLRRL